MSYPQTIEDIQAQAMDMQDTLKKSKADFQKEKSGSLQGEKNKKLMLTRLDKMIKGCEIIIDQTLDFNIS